MRDEIAGALVPTDATTLPTQTADPVMSMIERLAANPDVDVNKLQRLIDMQKDVMAVNAKAAFNAAFARMQAEIPTVVERGKTDRTPYATLEDIIEAVRPVLHRHGFSLSHRTEWPDKGTVKVIGILTHEQGFSRESEFLSAADASGSKNAIQALGSSVSYGRRYTVKDLLNIATRAEDDDGKKGGKPVPIPRSDADTVITPEQQKRLGAILKRMGRTPAEVKLWLKATYDVNASASILRRDYAAIEAALSAKGPLSLPGDGE